VEEGRFVAGTAVATPARGMLVVGLRTFWELEISRS